MGNAGGAAKIGKLCGVGLGDDDVLQLDVKMSDPLVVEIRQGGGNVRQPSPEDRGRQGACGGDLCKHIAGRGELSD